MSHIADEAWRLRSAAYAGPIGKRHSSFALYDLLAECMELAHECAADPVAFSELEQLVRDQPTEGKGRWIHRDSDEYILVCRFVFPRETDGKRELTNASRYAHALREAARRQIRPAELADFLRNQGGINALYLARELTRTSVMTKTLYLNQQIEVPKGRPITLRIVRTGDNKYDVLEVSHE